MWARVAAAAAGVVLVTSVASGATDASGRRDLAVRVHITNSANIPRDVLVAAAEDASAVYEAAGVSLIWEHTEAAESRPCATAVRLVLVSGPRSESLRAEVNASEAVMGFTPCAHAPRCRLAYVFYDHVSRIAGANGVAVSRVLGQVIAHEMGHMWLPPSGHSTQGIMRPSLDLRSSLLQQFTIPEAQRIRARLFADAALVTQTAQLFTEGSEALD